ncbi:hypothetical protein [Ectopseudomonas toyotomiensis]|uniref:Lipoprotein n=1 Tax=Ectopseudomonas toyotomiensis TaxID=554344 RepID=A0AA42LEN5_9GAMM|nr:hypothetical protein [Pseudomonas toyotomiensis]MBG0841628.1 hypothetical protein [Pseudomonas toyotomiensis]MDH0702796.1 hypothetical protein [Pseudomonas toyotomiensis]
MNKLQKGLGLSVLALLGACSNDTPGCADDDTTDLLREIVEEHFLESAYGRQLRPMVEYSIRGVRTEAHDEKLDSYQCSATLTFHLTSNPSGPAQKHDIEYEVHSIEDPDADFEISYTGIKEGILKAAMAKGMGWK